MFDNTKPTWNDVASRGGALMARRVMAVLVVVGVLLDVCYFLLSDAHYLAAVRMQDDSFYYLQPAWMFKTTHTFTVDGETATYGFQPLWMIVLTAVAHLVPSKIALLRATLILGAAFY